MSLKREDLRTRSMGILMLTFLCTLSACGEKLDFTSAVLSYIYQDFKTGQMVEGGGIMGFFGLSSRLESEEGRLVHVLTQDGANHGCTAPQNVPAKGSWIALIERGVCKFHDKIVRAVEHNASAVIVYDNEHKNDLLAMTHYMDGVVAVFIRKIDGDHLAELADSGINVVLNISVGQQFTNWYNGTTMHPESNRNNIMLITTLIFLVLLIVGVISLLIYAAHRSKYLRNKHRTPMAFAMQETGQAQENLLSSNTTPPSSNSQLEQM